MARLRTLADGNGRTIVVVLHDVNYAAARADRIVALKDGSVLAEGAPDAVLEPGLLHRVFGIKVTTINVSGRLFVDNY
jgi:iron complex transport system ATP-binding protein